MKAKSKFDTCLEVRNSAGVAEQRMPTILQVCLIHVVGKLSILVSYMDYIPIEAQIFLQLRSLF